MKRSILTRPGTLSPHAFKMLRDPDNGIERASGVVTNGSRGPGLGGTREYKWESDAAMLEDNFLLAVGMENKSLFHGLPYAGGKVCVELVSGADVEKAYTTLAHFVGSFDGALVTTEDMNTDPFRMSIMHAVIPDLILGRPINDGGSGDPSPYTASGVIASIEAWARVAAGRSDLESTSVYVKGVGHVGEPVVRGLIERGATVIVSDISPDRIEPWRGRVRVVNVDDPVEADVFCPCARGGEVGHNLVHRVHAIIGAANNQLTSDDVAMELWRRGIVYVPDWAANGGGLVSVAAEHMRRSRTWAAERAKSIGDRIYELLEQANREARLPLDVAYDICERNRAISKET